MSALETSPHYSTFVVLFHGRTGSSHLMSLLSCHPEIKTSGELLVGHANVGKQMDRARTALTLEPGSSLRSIGFKTKFKDVLDFREFKKLLHELRCRIIYMERRNYVKWVVSRLNAVHLHETVGKWNLRKGDVSPGPLRIDLERFDSFLRDTPEWVSRAEEIVQELDRPVLRVSYEQLLTDRNATVATIFSYLQVGPSQTDSVMKKSTSDDLRDAITNFDELRERYAGTPYAPMFDEVLVPLSRD